MQLFSPPTHKTILSLADFGKWINTSCLIWENPMNRKEEFLSRALEIHHEYEAASAVIRDMLRENITTGPKWDTAVARQLAALDAWAELPRRYGDLKTGN
ncbi:MULTISPECIES: hypothetical protein [Pseudomonas]|uniref:hypothetical protein n=1 Tax=Pseudomonas TaxID=286 RepID=UPI001F295AF2|nr:MULTISPECIES: hypothetical protein [Pseudomonas]